MTMRILAAVAAALALGALGFRVLDQEKRIERLSAEVKALREQRVEPGVVFQPSTPVPRPSTPTGAEPASAAPAPAVAVAPRAPVSRDEIARVESAVLSLLETDHPELRDKLRAVVQEQQQSLEAEQREERRERWIARNEARLIELSTRTGITAEQREQLSNIILATRDQVADVRQAARTPEEITAARAKVRALRDQSDVQIRELLSAPQYEAFQEEFGDDDSGPDRRRARNSPLEPR